MSLVTHELPGKESLRRMLHFTILSEYYTYVSHPQPMPILINVCGPASDLHLLWTELYPKFLQNPVLNVTVTFKNKSYHLCFSQENKGNLEIDLIITEQQELELLLIK